MIRDDYSPESTGIVIRPMQPDDHLEPAGARATKTLDRLDYLTKQNILLKALWVRELMRQVRRDQVYSAFELDHAKQEATGWTVENDGHGNYSAERQS